MRSFVSKHKFLTLGFATFFLSVVGAAGLFFYDAPAPDDRGLLPAATTVVAPQDNAAYALNALSGALAVTRIDYPEWEKTVSANEWNQLISRGIGAPALRTQVLEHYTDTISLLREAATKPGLYLGTRYPNMPDYNEDGTVALEYFKEAISLLRIMYTDDQGQFRPECWDEALAMLELARKCTAASERDYDAVFSGLFLETKLLEIIAQAAGTANDRDKCIEIARRLIGGRDVHAVYENLLKQHYVSICAWAKLNRNPWYRCYQLKSNVSRRMMGNLIREAIACSTRHEPMITGPYMKAAATARDDHSRINLQRFAPNYYGTNVCLYYSRLIETSYSHLLSRQTLADSIGCAFALRAYWLDHGTLPESLDALVPQYLPAVPLDLFGNQPLQYNKEKRLVYSAGENLIYDDGAYALLPGASVYNDRAFCILDWTKTEPTP